MRLAIASAFTLLVSAGAAQAACTFDIADGLNTKGKGIVYPGAEGREWFTKKAPISVAGEAYEAYGLPREFRGIDFGLLERGGAREVVYVPVSAAACTFQPYQKKAK